MSPNDKTPHENLDKCGSDSECMDRLTQSFVDELTHANGKTKIADEYAAVLDPHRDKPYPMNHVGTLLRVTKEFLPNWVDFDDLLFQTRTNNSTLDQAVIQHGPKRSLKSLKQACYHIGSASYTPEWLDQKTQDHLEVIDQVAEGVVVSNRALSCDILPYAIDHLLSKKTPYTILDIGPGVGGTIIPLIEGLDMLSRQGIVPEDYGKRLNVVLLDVMPKSLEYTKRRLTKEMERAGDGPRQAIDQVTTIATNFADISEHPTLASLKGSIDAIISGGAIMHNTDKDPFFQTMYDSLSPGGKLAVWDWSAGYCWAAPSLRLGELNGYHIDDHVYQITPLDVPPIYENLITGWMGDPGLFGYHGPTYEDLHVKLNKDFHEGLVSPQGFNYIQWLEDNVAGKVPEPPEQDQTPYNLIEGYGPGEFYAKSMRKAGFKHPLAVNFRDANIFLDKPLSEVACSSALFFASGHK